MSQRRFGRLTNAHSKRLANHLSAVALYVAHYNLCRVHETLRETPAMALGIAAHPWSIGELLDAALAAIPNVPVPTAPEMPDGIAIEKADRNSIVLDLGGGSYALYADLRAGSIKVKPGDRVKLGQVMARVGNSGNTLAQHLHFHVMDAPVPIAAN